MEIMESIIAVMEERLKAYTAEYNKEMEYYTASIEREKRTANFEYNAVTALMKLNDLHSRIHELQYWFDVIKMNNERG